MSTLNKISLDGTVYDIGGANDCVYQATATSQDPFIITEHKPGVYFFNNSLSGSPYVKWKATDPSKSWLSPAGVYFFWDTDGDNENSRTIGEVINFSTNPGLSTISYSSMTGRVSAGRESWPILMVTNQNSTITATHTFDVLPQSTVTPTNDAQLVNKKYVDDSILPYEDNGYYVKPTKWTVVSALPTEAIDDTTLYIVAPDYEERTVSTTVVSNGFNSGVDWSHITNNLIKVGTTADPDIVESWQNTAENSGSYTTNWSVKTPKYNVNIGCSPVFTNTYNEDLYMHGLVEMRDSRGYLRYTAYVDVNENLQSGQLCYYDRDDEETYTDPISLNTNCPISFNYTIGTNGGLACLKGDTPIKIKGGKTKMIKNIKVGDTVIGADGKETKVIKLYNHKVPVTFNITLSNDDVLVASDCHKFSIKGHYRYACQVVKDHKLDRVDGSTFDVLATEVKEEETEVYEILTESGTYTLGNGIICECEAI